MRTTLQQVAKQAVALLLLLHLDSQLSVLHATGGPGTALILGAGYVYVPHDPVLNAYPMSITAWFNAPNLPQLTNKEAMIVKSTNTSGNGWQIFLNSNRLHAAYFNATGSAGVPSSSLNGTNSVTDSSWHHLAFTVDASGGKLYVDGVLNDSKAWTGTPGAISNTNDLRFGVFSTTGGSNYVGMLDEITVWNVALSQTQIQTNKNRSLTGSEPGLIAYYRCDEGSGSTLDDSAPASGDSVGTIVGASFVSSVISPFTPDVETSSASPFTSTSAAVYGLANPEGINTYGWFEWGSTTNFGNSTASQLLGNGSNNISFGDTITPLVATSNYFFRAVASSPLGTVYGARQSYTASIFPVITTQPATGIGLTNATFNGSASANGANPTVWFEYGTNSNLGSVTQPQTPGGTNFSQSVFTLLSDTTYYFHAVGSNAGAIVAGGMQSFSTQRLTTETVTSTADRGAGSLRSAIASSESGDTIVLSVSGMISLTTGELLIDHNLTIAGPGANNLDISANNNSRVFEVLNGTMVKISDLTISSGRVTGTNAGAALDFGDAGGDAQGGAILNNGALTLSNCVLNGNSAMGGTGGPANVAGKGGNGIGGAIYNGGFLTAINCTCFGNSALGGANGVGDAQDGRGGDGLGGAIYNDGSLALTNCTVSLNSATGASANRPSTATPAAGGWGEGGGIWNDRASLSLAACTINGNSATGGAGGDGTSCSCPPGFGGGAQGGGLYNPNTGTTCLDTIIANDIVTAGASGAGSPGGGTSGSNGPDVYGKGNSQGHNLIGITNDSTGWMASDLVGTTASPQNPLLGTLADNGGSIYTTALLAGSPAIDAGDDSITNSVAFDERGHPRRAGAHVDIGAYEVNPPLTILVLNTSDPGAGSLRQAIVLAAPGDSISFASGVSGTISLASGELAISKNLTILGPTADGVTVSGVNRVFHFSTGTTNWISNLTIANGHTSGSQDGAGCLLESSGSLVMSNCAFTGNFAGGNGGALADTGGSTLTVVNCTLFGNQASQNGGGIYNSSVLNLFSCTIASNTATMSGGGVYNTASLNENMFVRSSVIAGNSSPSGPDVKTSSGHPLMSQGFNLVGDPSGSTGFTAATDQTGVDPKLGPLAANGGPTMTMSLLTGSPAIDKGNSFGLTTDQRGYPRPVDFTHVANATGGDGSDIGALELNGPQLNIQKIGANAVLSWPNLGTFTLQSVTNLPTSNNWTVVGGSATLVGDQYRQTNGPVSGKRFFRLLGL